MVETVREQEVGQGWPGKKSGSFFRLRALLFFLLPGILIPMLGSCGKFSQKPEERIYHLVFDVSGSMGGPDGVMVQVKRNISRLLEIIQPGDRVIVYTFAGQAEVLSSLTLETVEDRKKIKEIVSGLDPAGAHTDMKALLDRLSQDLREGNSHTRHFVIVLTDGIDDPAPEVRRRELDLEGYRESGQISESYVYYINLGKLRDRSLEEGLGAMSTRVKVVEPLKNSEKPVAVTGKSSEAPVKSSAATANGKRNATASGSSRKEAATKAGKAGAPELSAPVEGSRQEAIRKVESVVLSPEGETEDELGFGAVSRDIQKITLEKSIPEYIIYGVAGFWIGILFLAGVLFWFSSRSLRVLSGTLALREHGTPAYTARVIKLDRFRSTKLTLGPYSGSMIRLKDLGVDKTIILRAKMRNDQRILVPAGGGAKSVRISSGKGVISPGDEFSIGNYLFEYGDAQK